MMKNKLEILRLVSSVDNGVSPRLTQAIDLIYSGKLQEYGLNYYSLILINQIGESLEEKVLKHGKDVYINVRYAVDDEYEIKNSFERNLIHLDIINTALIRLAAKDPRFDLEKIELIKKDILDINFLYEFDFKIFSSGQLTAKLTISPFEDWFDYYVTVGKSGHQIIKLLIFRGKPSVLYASEIFSSGKWQTNNEFIITDKNNEVEIHVRIDNGEVKYINLSPYEKPPYFEMMRADISKIENENAYRDWMHSLPPDVSGIITYEPN
jgi:hypothetical protein